MHALLGTKQCDSILLFFCLTKCVRFISSYKDSSNVGFCFKADEDSMKIICVLFIPKLHFRHSYYSEQLQHFLKDSNFFFRLLHLNSAFLFPTTNRNKKSIIKSMRDIDYCDSDYCHKKQPPMTASFSEGFYFSLKTLEEACYML